MITYLLLSPRHKAIVKTKLLHTFGIIDKNWEINGKSNNYQMTSPTFLLDGIYKSMEGPKSSRYIQLNQNDSLLWITKFKVEAIEDETKAKISNDYICHTNIDLNDESYYTSFGLQDRIGKQYPRLTSLSNGFETIDFPEGYGIPIRANEFLYVTTQALNHNQAKILKKIKHLVTISYENYAINQKPLMSKTVFIQLPYNKENPYEITDFSGSDQCIPVETKNHSYADGKGNMLSGHWVIAPGKKVYKSEINSQLQLKDSLRLHYAAIHVHPFATRIKLYDKTTKTTVFSSTIENYKNKIGLLKVTPFSSKTGIWLYENHEYELQLETNNTSIVNQDMMGSMFLFFYDKELDEKLKQLK